MYINKINIPKENDSIEEKLKRFEILKAEANTVRENDKILIRRLFRNFYGKQLSVGIGFQRAYGSVLSGDYFDLIKLPDDNFLFVFADVSGHGLPAYTTLIRLRSAITIAIKRVRRMFDKKGTLNTDLLVKYICSKFTDIMDESNSDDFACVNFTFLYKDIDRFLLRFYNRSMLFPIVIRKSDMNVDIYNLNNKFDKWEPRCGYILGSDIRQLLKDKYLDTPSCEITVNESDSILFFSDGITEIYNPEFSSGAPDNGLGEEFGDARIEKILIENSNSHPQEIINKLFNTVYEFMGHPERQKDDMTAVLIGFPPG